MHKVIRVVGLLFLFLATFCIGAAHAQSAPLFRFDQKPGPYAVGLKVVQQYDYSRPSLVDALGRPIAGARPLQTLVWYPAKKTDQKPMTVADYANLKAAETNFDHPKIEAQFKEGWLDGMGPTLTTKLWAVRDAGEEPGRFPVIVYAPSFSATAWENADLCEYLATHGYVVLSSPNMGSSTRAMTPDLDGIRTQARDISFLIGYARGLPNTDMSLVAVGGFSWGGISNLFAAADDNRIRALFALDGSMRYLPGLIKKSGDAHPEQMTIPLLFFVAGAWTKENEQIIRNLFKNEDIDGPNVLNAWTHGDLITVNMLGMTHQEFSSMFQRNEEIWKIFPQFQLADFGRDTGIPEYAWMARYTLAFLDAYLKHDSGAMDFLKKTPAENGVPPHFMATSDRAAMGIAPSLEAFRQELGRQGYEHAPEIYASLQKQGFKLEESKLNHWGYELMAIGAMPQAISILKLQVQLYPDAWNPYNSLAEAYMKSGNKQLAIENYRKSLQLNPDNEGAKQKLKELGASSGNS